MLETMPSASPKMQRLFDQIKALDKRDMRKHGKKFKHFIFSDVKAQGYGAKILAAAFIAQGYHLVFNDHFKINPSPGKDNFGVLSSTALYGKPFSQKLKKNLLKTYNTRPDNVYGKNIRIIIFDSGFKEGIDLYDVKYVHLFETPLSEADRKQAVGRATRTCGQKGLQFIPNKGWPLEIFVYQNKLDHPDYQTVHELLYSYSGVELSKINTINELSLIAREAACDYELNDPVNKWSRKNEPEVPIIVPLLENGAPRLKSKKTTAKKSSNVEVEELSSSKPRTISSLLDDSIIRALPEIPKSTRGGSRPDDKFKCTNKCGKRANKEMPFKVNTMTLVWLSLHPQLPTSRYYSRAELCRYLKTDSNYCQAITKIANNPSEIQYYANLLLHRRKGKNIRKRIKKGKTVHKIHTKSKSKTIKKTQTENSDVQKLIKGALEENRIVPYKAPGQLIVHPDYKKSSTSRSISSQHGSLVLLPKPTRSMISSSRKMIEKRSQSELSEIISRLDSSSTEILKDTPVPFVSTKPLTMIELRAWIRAHYKECCTWKSPTYSNRCVSPKKKSKSRNTPKTPTLKDRIRTFQPTQEFARHYFNPGSPYGGLLLYHSVGTGKTCSAIGVASTHFEPNDYTIMWVTRTTLKSDIWKDMFDNVCNVTLQREILEGRLNNLPEELGRRRRLLGKRWLEPISYKQFSNALANKNKYGSQLREINGQSDPLRKTLIIIDEAHKLYGGTDLKGSEKANTDVIEKMMFNSYTKSGRDSARLLVMTATPVTNDPMEMIKLLNLLERDPKKRFNNKYENFQKDYLTSDGLLQPSKKQQFMNQISGYISHLDREGDPTQFAQPRYHTIQVNMSTSKLFDEAKEKRECCEKFDGEIDKYGEELSSYLSTSYQELADLSKQYEAKFNQTQDNIDKAEKKDKQNYRHDLARLKREYNAQKRTLRKQQVAKKKSLSASIKETKSQKRECLREVRTKKQESSKLIDQPNMIVNRCKVNLN